MFHGLMSVMLMLTVDKTIEKQINNNARTILDAKRRMISGISIVHDGTTTSILQP